MRNAARLKMGYYPLPEVEGAKLRSLLSFTGPASVIDPCVGQGTALASRHQRRARFAAMASNSMPNVHGSPAPTASRPSRAMPSTLLRRPESFSLLYLNPPYDSEIGSIANRRMEAVFLEHTYRWLAMEGVLVLVIPFERLHDCAGILSSHFAALNVFRMTDPDSVQYRQIAVLGVRRDVSGVGR